MTRRTPRRRQAIVERKGTDVTVTITCADHYDAMELYDRLCRELASGGCNLQLTTTEKEAP